VGTGAVWREKYHTLSLFLRLAVGFVSFSALHDGIELYFSLYVYIIIIIIIITVCFSGSAAQRGL
jgi:hypothetical protein